MYVTPDDLAKRMAEKTDQQLLDMLLRPSEWSTEALDAARAQIRRRAVPLPPEPQQEQRSRPEAQEIAPSPGGALRVTARTGRRTPVVMSWDSPAIRKIAGDVWTFAAPEVCVGCGAAAALTQFNLSTQQRGVWALILAVAVGLPLAFYLGLGRIEAGVFGGILAVIAFLIFRVRTIVVSYSQCAPCVAAQKRDHGRATFKGAALFFASAAAAVVGGSLADQSKGSPVLVGVFGFGGLLLMLVLFALAIKSIAGAWGARRLVARGRRSGLTLAARSPQWAEAVRDATAPFATRGG